MYVEVWVPKAIPHPYPLPIHSFGTEGSYTSLSGAQDVE